MRALTFFAAVFLAVSCHGAAPEKLKVSSFSTILTEVAQSVGGDRVEVTGHVTWEENPHEYSPTTEVMKAAEAADLVLLSGKHLETYAGKLAAGAGGKKRVLEVGAAIPPVRVGNRLDGEEDAHWWQSVPNVEHAAKIVRDAFGALRPADKTYFAANAEKYIASLEELQKWVKTKVAELSHNHRKLATNYDGFSYFAKEYGFEIIPIEGVSTGNDSSTKSVVDLIKLLKQQRIKAVFSDPVENPTVMEEIKKSAGATYGVALNLEGLGEGEQSTYAGMMRYNVAKIVDALK